MSRESYTKDEIQERLESAFEFILTEKGLLPGLYDLLDIAFPDCNPQEQEVKSDHEVAPPQEQGEVEVRLSREEAEAVRSQLAYLGHKIGSASIHTRTLYRSATAKLRTALEEEGR